MKLKTIGVENYLQLQNMMSPMIKIGLQILVVQPKLGFQEFDLSGPNV